MQKHFFLKFLLSQLQHIINIDTRKHFYNAHIKPHIDYAKYTSKNLTPYIKGQANQSFLILHYLQSKRWEHLEFYTYRNSYLTIKEYLCINFLIIIPQITWHNSVLVTSPTTSTPGITSTCQGQGLTNLKLAYPSLECPSETPCLRI